MTETYESVKPDFSGHDVCICGHCSHIQYELPHPLDKGGKYAWQCRMCGTANEGDEVHLLENMARFRSKYGIEM
ncbi:hypothetical protein EVB55_173 [Rhizobium phage RHph_Y68]|uniref:Uncharacterized protein n=1 Tax=Rhizobium phage RHph_Y68 TaxID=2509787 RepID=A0A7S5UUH1_9CAUD|nr:hypothetical protein PP934_gp173 [Rhizobium phage RHph_Y68]QIG68108.1 hypothetical protein EVB55_173 [Rhizobium phage RHph_Y68]